MFDAGRVIEHACLRKRRYTTPGEARDVARRMNDQARRESGVTPYRVYRCPFGDGCRHHAHFHVGHVPSLEGLQDIARAIREQHEPQKQQAAS